MLVPNIQGKGLDSATIGMAIMPYNFKQGVRSGGFETKLEDQAKRNNLDPSKMDNVRSYQDSYLSDVPGVTTAPDLVKLNVECYPTGSPDSGFSRTVDINPGNWKAQPIAVKGKASLSGDGFMCEWEYVNSNGNVVKKKGKVVNLGKNVTEKQFVLRQFFKEDRGFSGIQMTYDPDDFSSLVDKWQANAGDFYTVKSN